MPDLNLKTLGVNPVLTNISVSYARENADLVHHRVFPVVPVEGAQFRYFRWDKEDMLRIAAQRRAPGTPTARKTFGLEQASGVLEQWGVETGVSDEWREEGGSPLADLTAITEAVAADVLGQKEQEFVSSYMNPSSNPWSNAVLDGSTTDFTQWDSGGSEPLKQIKSWILRVQLACGKKPNKLVLDAASWAELSEHATVLTRLADTKTKDVTRETVAALLGLDELLVADAVYNAAEKGATYNGQFVVPEGTALLAYAPSAPSKMAQAAGYTFSWERFDKVRASVGDSGAPAIDVRRDEAREEDVLRAKTHSSLLVVSPDAGQLIRNILGG